MTDETTQAANESATTEERVNVENEAGDVVSVAVAKGIFESRPDVAAVVTDNGVMHRDGTFS